MGGLVVVYDRGAVSPGEIAVGLAGLAPVAFLVADSAHTRRLSTVLSGLGPVRPLTGDHDADLAAVRALAPAGILTFSEPVLAATARLAEALGLPGHPAAAVPLLTDKVRQRERLRAAGVDDVRSRPLSSVDDWPAVRAAVGLPAVVKPVHGEGSRHTRVVHDDAAARRAVATALGAGSPVVVEELLRGRPGLPLGDYVSIESACGPYGIRHLGITGKLPLAAPFRETGRFWPALLSPTERAEVADLVSRALAALEVGPGLTHTEVKLTAAGPRIIEVNGRLGGHVAGLAKQVGGGDLVRLAGRLALGGPVDPPADLSRPARVHLQHNTVAPVEACRLLAVHGATAVRRVAGVDGFRLYARPGTDFDADVMTRHLDLLWGRCDDHAGIPGLLRRALSTVEYEFRFAGGVRRVPAADLGGWSAVS